MRSSSFALLTLLTLAAGCDKAGPVTETAAASSRVGRPGEEPRALEVVRAGRAERGATEEAAAECTTSKSKIRFASPDTARRAGLEAVTVTSRPLPYSTLANGSVALDDRRVARLSSPVRGIVRDALKLPGDDVEEGAVLARVESVDLGAAKARLRQAAALSALREKNWAIERELIEGKISSRREALAAEAATVEARIERERARQELTLLGVPPGALDGVEAGEDTSTTIEVRAPLAGSLIERSSSVGEMVDAGRQLFVIADLAKVLIAIDLTEQDYAHIEVGARVLFTPDGLKGEVFRGKIASRGAALDPETRTVRALAEVKNAPRAGKRILAPGMFGRVEIVVREAEEALVIPRVAVQWEGCHNVVFLEVRPGFYQTAPVELGVESGGWQEVRSGLEPGARVVTTGSFLLKTEILKGSIGAGCCD